MSAESAKTPPATPAMPPIPSIAPIAAKDKSETKEAPTPVARKAKVEFAPPGPHLIDCAKVVTPGNFEVENHFYPRVINAQIHPMVSSFLSLGNDRIMIRYCHLNPRVKIEALRQWLTYQPKFFRWAGSDVFCVATGDGGRRMIVIETNSCPSGQKSMPYTTEDENESLGYHNLLQNTFVALVNQQADKLPKGDLAVVYDKNEMEAAGYAAELANITKENIWLVEFYEDDPNPPVRWEDGVMLIRDKQHVWHPIRAAFRYVTQRPWTRFPVISKTLVLNPVLACLAGGRNKMVAAKAYDIFNAENAGSGLEIRIPETIKDVNKNEVPLWVKSFGGRAVIKAPYTNAGQGVFTITSSTELEAFMNAKHHYDKFIVQSLVGNGKWTSITRAGQYFHIGTVPNRKGETYVADLRMMVGATSQGYKPIVMYARRAHKPLVDELTPQAAQDSWAMLGTNLSVKMPNGQWTTESNRLCCMDRRDFNKLGLGIDDLIDAYVQTVLSAVAIDKMCRRLIDKDGEFNFSLFASLNEDPKLLDEIMDGGKKPSSDEFHYSDSHSAASSPRHPTLHCDTLANQAHGPSISPHSGDNSPQTPHQES